MRRQQQVTFTALVFKLLLIPRARLCLPSWLTLKQLSFPFRPECARVLLFRGADPMIVNKQNQTALHVAHIVGNLAVADVIQRHNPQGAGKFRHFGAWSSVPLLANSTLFFVAYILNFSSTAVLFKASASLMSLGVVLVFLTPPLFSTFWKWRKAVPFSLSFVPVGALVLRHSTPLIS